MTENEYDDMLREATEQIEDVVRTATKQLRYEAQIVRLLLRTLGLPAQIERELRQICQSRSGEAHLVFADFLDRFPTFPVWLTIEKVPHVHDFRYPEFINRFTKTPLYQAYQAALEYVPQAWRLAGKPIVLVYNGADVGTLVMHTMPPNEDAGTGYFMRPVKNVTPARIYCIEKWAAFIGGLAWRAT